jgi:hypothetical protein
MAEATPTIEIRLNTPSKKPIFNISVPIIIGDLITSRRREINN